MNLSCKFSSLKKTYRSMVFWGLILSYMTVLLIPMLLIGAVAYGKYNAVLEQKVGQSIHSMLVQMEDIVDSEMDEIGQLAIKTRKTKRLYSILTAQDISRFTPYELAEGVSEINYHKMSRSFIDNIIFYMPKDDTVITANNVTDMGTFCTAVNRYIDIPENEFRKKILKVSDVDIWPAQGVQEGKTAARTDKVTYVRSLASEGIFYGDIRMMVTINDNKFRELFTKVLGGYRGYVCIVDQEGRQISSLGNGELAVSSDFLRSIDRSGGNAFYTTTLGKQEVMVAFSKSLKTQWGYISIIPTDQVFTEVNHIRNLALYLMFATFLLCMLLIFFFANRNYSPIRSIMDMLLPEKPALLQTGRGNEWEFIKKGVYSALDGKRDLENYVHQQLPIIQSNYVLLLLKGGVQNVEKNTAGALQSKIEIGAGPFAVMRISIDGFVDKAYKEREISDEDMFLFKFSVCNVVEELCQTLGAGYAVESGEDEVAVLISLSGHDLQKGRSSVNEIAQKTVEFFKEQFEIAVTIGIGKLYADVADIKYSFKEAKTALEYKIIKGNNIVIDFNDIKVVPGFIQYYSMVDERKISDCLKRGDIKGIEQVLGQILENLQQNLPSVETARCIYFEILNTALQTFDIIGIENYDALPINDRFYGLFHSETLEQLYHEAISFYRDICLYINDRKESKNFQLAREILQFIDQNYCDKNLSLTMLADHFNMSTGYLSRFFKDQQGYNFSEYLQKRRIEMSKELLKVSEKNITDISDDLGFGNVHSFIKTFKKFEGITPGEFRTKMVS